MPFGPADALQNAALEPLTAAGKKLESRNVLEAIQMLDPARLRVAVEQGKVDAARAASVHLADLERLIPAAQVNAHAAQIGQAQGAALLAARQFASSLMGAVGSARAPTVSESFRKLGQAFADDTVIAGPLGDLADRLGAYEAWIKDRSQAVRRDPTVVRGCYRKLALHVGAAGIGAAVALCLAGAFVVYWQVMLVARRHIDVALASKDPCAIENVQAKHWMRATADQASRRAERRRECDAERASKLRETQCDTLAVHVEGASMAPDDDRLAGAVAPLLHRVADKQLVPDDLLIDEHAMPCADTPVAARLWVLLGKTAGGSEQLWQQVEQVSPDVAKLLLRADVGLSDSSRQALWNRADAPARRAIVSGAPADMDHAKKICELAASLHVEQGRGCKALDKLVAHK